MNLKVVPLPPVAPRSILKPKCPWEPIEWNLSWNSRERLATATNSLSQDNNDTTARTDKGRGRGWYCTWRSHWVLLFEKLLTVCILCVLSCMLKSTRVRFQGLYMREGVALLNGKHKFWLTTQMSGSSLSYKDWVCITVGIFTLQSPINRCTTTIHWKILTAFLEFSLHLGILAS